MMTSFPENIPVICQVIASLNPRRLLDVGSGFGKFGLLARETLMAQAAERGDWTPKDNLYAACVENCKFFQDQPAHIAIYDEHYHTDVDKIDTLTLKDHDLTLMIDIVEHWPKEKLMDLLPRLGPTLISTPKHVHMYEQEFYGKDCPKHMTQWIAWDFRSGKNYSTEYSHIFLMNT